MGLFQPVKSAVLDERIPAKYRDPDGHWFGFSYRARVHRLQQGDGRTRPTSRPTRRSPIRRTRARSARARARHPYNLSLVAAMIAHDGEAKAEAWAKGVVANIARTPAGRRHRPDQGGRGRASAPSRSPTPTTTRALMRSTKPEDREIVAKTGVVLPDQADARHARQRLRRRRAEERAAPRRTRCKFLEYLASDEAQLYFADGNNEWPVVKAREGRRIRRSTRWAVQDRPAADRRRSAATPPRRRRSSIAPAGGDPVRAARSTPTGAALDHRRQRRAAARRRGLRRAIARTARVIGHEARRRRSRATAAPLRPGARPSRAGRSAWRACRS